MKLPTDFVLIRRSDLAALRRKLEEAERTLMEMHGEEAAHECETGKALGPLVATLTKERADADALILQAVGTISYLRAENARLRKQVAALGNALRLATRHLDAYVSPDALGVIDAALATLLGAAVPHHFLDCARGGCEECRDDDDPELRGTSHAPLIGEAIPEVRS